MSKIRQIGRYNLVRLLGAGGMGTVFKAIVETGQPVAIKLIKGPQAGSEDVRMRLVREAAQLTNCTTQTLLRYTTSARSRALCIS